MNKLYISLGALLLLAASFVAGYFQGKEDVVTVEKEKLVYKEGETTTVYKDRIITVIREVKPDGTVTEKTVTEEKDKTVDKKTAETKKDTDTTVTPAQSRFSVGLHAVRRWDDPLPTMPDLGVSVGMRVYGPVKAQGMVIPGQKTVTLGLEIEL